jgi:hypothetical protein
MMSDTFSQVKNELNSIFVLVLLVVASVKKDSFPTVSGGRSLGCHDRECR